MSMDVRPLYTGLAGRPECSDHIFFENGNLVFHFFLLAKPFLDYSHI